MPFAKLKLLFTTSRANFGNAKAAGLTEDLNMTDREYAIALYVILRFYADVSG